MIMGTTRLHRRTFLRGVGGAAVALPALEIMHGRTAEALPSTTPKRFALLYLGCSTGNNYTQMVQPPTLGAGYELNSALAPLAGQQLQAVLPGSGYRLNMDLDYDSVHDDVTIVSGLKIPWGSDVPPGGRVAEFHGGPSVTPVTSGMRSLSRTARPGGPTCDQILASSIATEQQQALGRGALVFRVQPISYYSASTTDSQGRLSWRDDGDGGVTPVEAVFSPRQAYESLVIDLSDPEALQAQLLLLHKRRSVLDLVGESAQRIMQRVGASDRVRLEQHYDEIRTLERKLEELEASAGDCAAFPHPGEDPPFGTIDTEGVETETNKWSNEELRAHIFTDIVTMAFACDLSRVVSLQLTFLKCYMNMYPVSGQLADMHNGTHNGEALAADAIGWGVSHFARLVARLRATTDYDGQSVLDNSALVLIFEGGVGEDPETMLESNAHSSENMGILVAGRAGGLKSGVHIHRSNATHPAQVVLSAMKACGHSSDALGEVEGDVPELFG
jgi:hypothetical protein